MQKRNAHNNYVTPERERFQSTLSQRAMGVGIPGFKVAAYKPGDQKTQALLRKRPRVPAPVGEWDRHRYDSQVVERGIRRALNPAESPDLSLDSRMRIAKASWTNSADWMALDDCIDVIMLSLHSKRRQGS